LVIASAAVIACGATKKSGFDDGYDGGNGTVGGGNLGGGGPGGATKGCAPAKGNFDIPGNNCDDDDDGTVDNPPSCDDSPGSSAADFAKAIGICATVDKDGYGLVSASFTQGVGDQHGVLPKFGNVLKPREGKSLGVLSSGYAQEFDGAPGTRFGGELESDDAEPGQDWRTDGTLPDGFPKAASGCEQASDVHDVIDLKLKLKAPNNSSGIKFDFNFLSGEWPAYICSQFNDGFIAYLSAAGFNGGTPDNISFDAKKNPISVNNGFFDRCTDGADIGCAEGAVPATATCPGGTSELGGTGFGITGKFCELYGFLGSGGGDKTSTSGGATGWLTSSAPVGGGEEFTLDLMIWDTGDGVLDSSVLVDNFSWAEGEVVVNTDRPK
jgi:hypothetical protein